MMRAMSRATARAWTIPEPNGAMLTLSTAAAKIWSTQQGFPAIPGHTRLVLPLLSISLLTLLIINLLSFLIINQLSFLIINLALCHLKLDKGIEARAVCDKAIEETDAVAKAWFGRGEAQLALNDCESAKLDFEKSLELEPDNKAAKNKVVICQQRIKAQKEKEKKTFANMFDKFAEIDKKREALDKLRRPDAMNNIDQWNSGGDAGIATDPNSIKVGGDVNMSLDINEAIKQDVELQEEA